MGDLPRPLRGLAMTDGVRISEGRIAMAPAGPRNDRGAIGVHRSLPSLPCARGGGTAQAVTEGLCAGSAEPRPAGERIAASLRSSQSTCFYECITVNETCVCRARPLGVPFAGSCIPFPTAKRRALQALFLGNDSANLSQKRNKTHCSQAAMGLCFEISQPRRAAGRCAGRA